jgi:hypothetical protein
MRMKTSNKILLGLLLCAFGYLTFAQITLHVKYENNDLISTEQYNAHFYDEHPFENIKHINITSLAMCEILPSATVKLSVEKSSIQYVQYKVAGDTLVITGQYPTTHSANSILNSSPQNVRLYMPPGVPVQATRANLNVGGNKAMANAGTFNFNLDNCNLFTRYHFYADSVNRYFNSFIIAAKNQSRIEFYHNDHFKVIQAQLAYSSINDYGAKIEQMNITPDSNSTIIVSGPNVNKLNTSTIR